MQFCFIENYVLVVGLLMHYFNYIVSKSLMIWMFIRKHCKFFVLRSNLVLGITLLGTWMRSYFRVVTSSFACF